MRTKSTLTPEQIYRLGGAQGGTASALAVGREAEGHNLFLGGAVGVYRAVGHQPGTEAAWERLPNAPIGVVALAASPNYAQDHTLFAGTNTGVYLSADGGETWQAGETPIEGAVINAISFSPRYAQDGNLLAGTLEDGILASTDRGATWRTRNFGVLDAAFFAIAYSPDFPRDETAFAGSDTALYYTYNGGRAWKMANFPEEATPVLSLALSASYADDHTLFAGTESRGAFRSIDAGASWTALDLPAACINALAAQRAAVLAATEAGVFRSLDNGQTWDRVLDQPDAISLAAAGEVAVAGFADQGAWVTADGANWAPAGSLAARPVVGLAIPEGFDDDGIALMYGPGEGIWRTVNGGANWEPVNEALPTLDIRSVAVSPSFGDDKVAVAASDEGVLVSQDGGASWEAATSEPAGLAAFSPNGKLLAASFEAQDISLSADLGQTWRHVLAKGQVVGQVLALAVGNGEQVYLAALEGMGETVGFWQGLPGEMEKVHSLAVDQNPVAAIWVPAEAAADRPWYAALGNQVLKFSSRKGRKPAAAEVFEDAGLSENIVALAGVRSHGEQVLVAATGRHLYQSADGQAWSLVYDFGNERAVTVVTPASYLKDKAVYALLIGGTLARVVTR